MKTFLYGTADILVYASHYDSCPRPPLEAMASGVAVVCTETTGALEYCRDGENCLLVPIKSPDSLCDAIERVMDDKMLRETLVRGGFETARRRPQKREWDELEDLLYKYYYEAVKPRNVVKSLTSIVIVLNENQEHTRECIQSIEKFTPNPHEVVLVTCNPRANSLKGIRNLINGKQSYKLIEGDKNADERRRRNQGIEASSGEYILLLNNDVVVTEGWLSGLLECLNSSPNTGIVGPMTNNTSGPQKVQHVEYVSIKELDAYARKFRERNLHRRVPHRRIVGFCMLFRRELMEKVCGLDESFGTGNFEDDDYCLLGALEGYQNVIAGDVFIHHYGSRSFTGNAIDCGSTMTGHRKIFTEKWRIDSDSILGKKLLTLSALENADELGQQGKADKAVEQLIEAIGKEPENSEIYHALAEILLEAKRFQESLDALKSMPDEGKEDIRTMLLHGYCAEGLGRYQEAEEHVDAVLEKDSGNALAMNLKGMLAYKRDDRKAAEIFFKKAIDTDPGYGEPNTNLGVLQWSVGDREAGISLLEKGFILSPKVMDIATMYHAALCEMRAFERGEKIFREAKGLYPQNQRIAFLLIDLLLQHGKEKTAMEEIEEAMTKFTVEDGLLAAALTVREKVGAEEIDGFKKKGTLSLSMIVKNEEQHIAKCLMSVKPVVNEMIVVDTGSTDRTKNIAKALGAKVYDFEWTGDFSAARNYSLSRVEGEWVLSLDADEVISAKDHEAIRKTVSTSKPVAYKIVTRNYSNQVGAQGFTQNTGEYPAEEAGLGWFPSGKIRLFPNSENIRFENPVHEFVEGTVTKDSIPIKNCDISVHHYGRLNMEKVRVKGEGYYLLGIKKLEEKGFSDLKALFELGVQAGELKKYEEAAELFEKLVELDPNYPLALFNLGFAYLSLGRYKEGMEYSKRAFELDPSKKECAVNYAHSEIVAGDIKKGISLLEETLRKNPEYPPAMAILASAYAIEGRKQAGINIIEKLQANRFDCTNCLHDLADGLFITGRYQQAMSLYELIVQTRQLHNDTRERIDRCYEAICKAGMV
jgi:tetratricopeptide (TPR) repeat protein/GT2 family glycosyltransferase